VLAQLGFVLASCFPRCFMGPFWCCPVFHGCCPVFHGALWPLGAAQCFMGPSGCCLVFHRALFVLPSVSWGPLGTAQYFMGPSLCCPVFRGALFVLQCFMGPSWCCPVFHRFPPDINPAILMIQSSQKLVFLFHQDLQGVEMVLVFQRTKK